MRNMADSDSCDKLERLCLSAAEQIRSECDAILKQNNDSDSKNPQATGIADCGEPLTQLLGRQASQFIFLLQSRDSPEPETVSLLLRRLDDILSESYSHFYAYLFKELPVCWRQLYTDAVILKFAALYLFSYAGPAASDGSQDTTLDEMIKTLDLALILAGAAGEQRGRRWINRALDLLEASCNPTELPREDTPPSKRPRLSPPTQEMQTAPIQQDSPVFSTHEPFTPPVTHPIRRTTPLSLSDFQSYMDSSLHGPSPLIITSLASTWPCLTTHPWSRPSYLLSRTFSGRRLVPIELGRSYVDTAWSQRLLPFRSFLQTYITSPSPSPQTAYLAQHQLFTQLPALRNDILIPDYCYTAPPPHPTDPSADQPELDTPQLNAWFGPAGTITPLHTDPYHNLLVQVVGRKYVRLYSPHDTPRLKPRGREGGVEMGNTSTFDVGIVEGWDEPPASRDETSPAADIELFRDVPYVDCILEAGDTLYIPIGWWHYVKGLSVSFSVSFWWN
ncbi:hypothetical protein B0T16DRAFT_420009 [Cercophora newfieldiana]|uniref:JmjC domain-containing protein n=1 Tax=Cercophora newfieldiana TaxID=92897 RepID=A0AA39XWH8_9PEZI|nr:hypothetical protein B0T16DRAFT_420009 [Cercophora newfieldiana]